MNIITDKTRDDSLVESLLHVWEASVRKTHDFISNTDIRNLRPLVCQGIRNVSVLAVAVDANDVICGFMGTEKEKIEMLFIHPDFRGKGIGKKLVTYATTTLNTTLVDVNEQNPLAAGFYRHLGFRVISRSPQDSSENPFPILHLSL